MLHVHRISGVILPQNESQNQWFLEIIPSIRIPEYCQLNLPT